MHVYTCGMCLYACICVFMYMFLCVCVHVYIYVYVCLCVYMYVYMCVCVCVYVCMCVCLYVGTNVKFTLMAFYILVFYFIIKKCSLVLGRLDGSGVKNSCCSYPGPWFIS